MKTRREACVACDEPLEKGDLVYHDQDGGYIHYDCASDDHDAFCSIDTGEPLKPGEPIPEPFAYGTYDHLAEQDDTPETTPERLH